jgi:hypothetical protein
MYFGNRSDDVFDVVITIFRPMESVAERFQMSTVRGHTLGPIAHSFRYDWSQTPR